MARPGEIRREREMEKEGEGGQREGGGVAS